MHCFTGLGYSDTPGVKKVKSNCKRFRRKREPTMMYNSGCGESWKSYHTVSNNDKGKLLTINVSGERILVYENTLSRFPNSLLGDPVRRKGLWEPDKKEYFLDRNRPCFEAILQFYQTGFLRRPQEVTITQFIEEIEKYEFDPELIRQYKIKEGYILEPIYRLPKGKWRRRIWQIMEIPSSSWVAILYTIFSFLVATLSIGNYCVSTLPEYRVTYCHEISVYHTNGTITHRMVPNMDNIFFTIDAFCVIWFTVEYIVRVCACPPDYRLKFVTKPLNVLDLLTIIPFYLLYVIVIKTESCWFAERTSAVMVFRTLRVFHVFKISKEYKALRIFILAIRGSLQELKLFAFLLMVGCVLLAGTVVVFEEGEGKITSVPEGIWWALATMTTVGYGDVYPISRWGRIVGIVCFIMGCLVVALPTPVIVSNFHHYYKIETGRVYQDIDMF